MKLIAFYAVGILILCIMLFGGIEGFTFNLRIETGDYFANDSQLYLKRSDTLNADLG